MVRSGYRVLVAVLVAVVASSSLVTIASAGAPPPPSPKQEAQAKKNNAKAEADARKAEAEAEKQRRKCKAKGTLPCDPTLTLTWINPGYEGYCIPRLSVTGFAPTTIKLWTDDVTFYTLVVHPDGTGSVTLSTVHIREGISSGYIINGVEATDPNVSC